MRFTLICLLALLSVSANARPLESDITSYHEVRRWDWKLEDLNEKFLGIHWNRSFKDCLPWQLTKIIFATRYATKMLDLPDMKEDYFEHSEAWNRYFGEYKDWLNYGKVNVSAQIISNILLVKKFPKTGKAPFRTTQKFAYSCSYQYHPVWQACTTRTPAVTTDPRVSLHKMWTIHFCPAFWDDSSLDYLEVKENRSPMMPTDIESLRTYEYVLIHEYMHIDIIRFKEHIMDIKSPIDGFSQPVDIYGDIRCHMFAQRDLPGPTADTALNADSYGWFFTYYYFEKHWKWTTPIPDKKLIMEDLIEADELRFDPTPSFPVNDTDIEPDGSMIPANCQVIDQTVFFGKPIQPLIICDYVGEPYDQWMQNLGKPFLSNGGCELSAQLSAVYPACSCICEQGRVTSLYDEICAGFTGMLP